MNLVQVMGIERHIFVKTVCCPDFNVAFPSEAKLLLSHKLHMMLAGNIRIRHCAGGRKWYVFKNAKWHLMFNIAACFPEPGWTWPSALLVRWSYAFGSAHSSSIGLHLKGHWVLSDFCSLGKLRRWHCKNNNMLGEARGWWIKWVKRREWENNNNKLSC